MQDTDRKERREDLYSKVIRAGKRTYFFDVKATRSNKQYLTITESKRRFNEEQGKFYYEKHKIFLYPDDFDSFRSGLNKAISFIENGRANNTNNNNHVSAYEEVNTGVDVKFEDLGHEITE